LCVIAMADTTKQNSNMFRISLAGKSKLVKLVA